MSNESAVPNVLVVEDEMLLRMRAVDIVEDAGFNAVEATTADQALSVLESRADISLLFSDIQMPGTMGGLKLAQAVHERWPAIKIILVSGQVRPTSEERPAESRFFGKPLDVATMVDELKEMVGNGALKVVPKAAIPLAMEEITGDRRHRWVTHDDLAEQNESLRLLLQQATIDTQALLAQVGIDAREREAADQLQKLIRDELHHRIKNTLATVGAIASQSIRTSASPEDAQVAIEGRLFALGRAHDLLIQVGMAAAGLNETVRGAIEPYDTTGHGRFAVGGPDLAITSSTVIALAMTLNELCTNTTKFGALSVPDGRVEISWTTDRAAGRLALVWTEAGGPPVKEPKRRSFGTRMMGALGRQLQGDVDLAYRPTGFVYSLDVPLSAIEAELA